MGQIEDVHTAAGIFPNGEKLGRNFNLQIIANLDLAGKTNLIFAFLGIQIGFFGGQQEAGPLQNPELAQTAGTPAAAGTGDKY